MGQNWVRTESNVYVFAKNGKENKQSKQDLSHYADAFTAHRFASAVCAIARRVSVHPDVRLSVRLYRK